MSTPRTPPDRALLERAMADLARTMGKPLSPSLVAEIERQWQLEVQAYMDSVAETDLQAYVAAANASYREAQDKRAEPEG